MHSITPFLHPGPRTAAQTASIRHHTTIDDFRDFAADVGAHVEREIALAGGRQVRALPNLRADTAVFVLSEED